MPDRRIVGQAGARIPRASVQEQPPPPQETRGGGRGMRIVPVLAGVLVVVALALAAAVFLLARGDQAAQSGDPGAPAEGAVVAVEPVSVNLADGHYLRVGFSMQMTAEAGDGVDTARAQDTVIALYSGRKAEDLADGDQREQLRGELVRQLSEAYGGDVMEVYFTDFVTQ